MTATMERTVKRQAAYIQELEAKVQALQATTAAAPQPQQQQQPPQEAPQPPAAPPDDDALAGVLRLEALLAEREEELVSARQAASEAEREVAEERARAEASTKEAQETAHQVGGRHKPRKPGRQLNTAS